MSAARKIVTRTNIPGSVSEGHASLEGLSAANAEKVKAAYTAVDLHVKDGQVVGVGSGSTVVYAVHRLAQRVKEEGLKITCVPTSFQARNLIIEHKLPLSDLNIDPSIDVTIDGADEFNKHLDAIKGGGGCHLQEKMVAYNSAKLVLIADKTKIAEELGTVWKKGVPVEVSPLGYVPIMNKLKALGGNPKLREAGGKAGPCVTDNGNFILDTDFGEIKDPRALEMQVSAIPGVVETGLFVDMAACAYVGTPDGVIEFKKEL